MQVEVSDIKQVKNDEEVISVRGEFIPIVHLKDIFQIDSGI